MRLVSYRTLGGLRPGIVIDGGVFDIQSLLAYSEFSQRDCTSMRSFLEQFEGALGVADRELSSLATAHPECLVGPLADIPLGPPVPDPAKVLCVGLNYADHVTETGRELPKYPDIFVKFASSLVGPFDPLALSHVTEKLDYEVELAVVIGKACRNVAPEQALEHVAGAMILNDISARDLQFNGNQWTPGKAVDASTPCGPELITLDEVGELSELTVATYVNGEERQRSGTDRMIFSVSTIVSYISHFLELRPGDVISTGTPEGIGSRRTPPTFMVPGDVVQVEITGLGAQRNKIQ